MTSEFLFVEKYRPQVIDDCILPDDTKKTFKEFVEKGEIPNLLLSGPPGIGKTTIAKALCNELGADFYVINGSDEGRFLDTVRNQAKNFASTVSLTGSSKHKVIIIDEADNTVEYDQKVIAELVSKHFPDFRRVLNECQRYSTSGKIDAGILASFSDVSVNDLLKYLKEKNFTEVRKWVVSNLDNDSSVILRRVYDALYDVLVPASIPSAVLIIAKYQYQICFVADQEINLLAALTEIMCEVEFK
jgi:SpoVK/Ycf46/Vps4 family AAA+-type ATPase